MTDVFLLTSVIKVSAQPWTYTHIRSLFTPKERYQQTLKSIASIRKYHPEAKILLVEGSALASSEEQNLIKNVDWYHNINTCDKTQAYCHKSKNKGRADAWMIYSGLVYLQKLDIEIQRIYKLSGRYCLNEFYREGNFSLTKPSFHEPSDTKSYVTFLYSVPGEMLKQYLEIMENMVSALSENPIQIESQIAQVFPDVQKLEVLGAEGLIAVNGSETRC